MEEENARIEQRFDWNTDVYYAQGSDCPILNFTVFIFSRCCKRKTKVFEYASTVEFKIVKEKMTIFCCQKCINVF